MLLPSRRSSPDPQLTFHLLKGRVLSEGPQRALFVVFIIVPLSSDDECANRVLVVRPWLGSRVRVSRSASDESIVEKQKQRVPAADIDNVKIPHR